MTLIHWQDERDPVEAKQHRLESSVVRTIFKTTHTLEAFKRLQNEAADIHRRLHVPLYLFQLHYPEFPITLTATQPPFLHEMTAWELLDHKELRQSRLFRAFVDTIGENEIEIHQQNFGMVFRVGSKKLFIIHNMYRHDRVSQLPTTRLTFPLSKSGPRVILSVEPFKSFLSTIDNGWVNHLHE